MTSGRSRPSSPLQAATEDVVPWVDERCRTLAAARHRGITGHSSGGYGRWSRRYAPDELFGCCYLPEFGVAARRLCDAHEGSVEGSLAAFRAAAAALQRNQVVLNAYAMAAGYSADLDGTVQLPFDVERLAGCCPTSGSDGSCGTRSTWPGGTPARCA